nr:ubiquitin carboxyl-terminal hydrolase 11-like isoform X2 [Cherax quadricarinatus]
MLEETDSWFCPKCERKQPATKTISVWRYPPYLIIHLERFLFHGTMSTKLDDRVIFPLDGLDVSDYVASGASISQLYNLYACVCHMGVAQAGHYTAFARSPVTGEWHHFNDDSVTRQKPREEEYSTAYLLFYHRQGKNLSSKIPSSNTRPSDYLMSTYPNTLFLAPTNPTGVSLIINTLKNKARDINI